MVEKAVVYALTQLLLGLGRKPLGETTNKKDYLVHTAKLLKEHICQKCSKRQMSSSHSISREILYDVNRNFAASYYRYVLIEAFD